MAECVFGLADLPPVPAARVFEVLQGDRYDRQAGPKCFLVVLHDDAGDADTTPSSCSSAASMTSHRTTDSYSIKQSAERSFGLVWTLVPQLCLQGFHSNCTEFRWA